MYNAQSPLKVVQMSLANFRCFEKTTVHFNNSVIVICGLNGTGKTSLLEALHYSCYLKSFRTSFSREIISLNKDSFFIKLVINNGDLHHTITIGFSKNKRLVKIDNKAITSYRDLLNYYRVVSLTEHDLALVQGDPERRRVFLDQAIVLDDYSFLSVIREFKTVLNNRNALLQNSNPDQELYEILSKQLWDYTCRIEHRRKQFLKKIEDEVIGITKHYFNDEFEITFAYRTKRNNKYTIDCFFLARVLH